MNRAVERKTPTSQERATNREKTTLCERAKSREKTKLRERAKRYEKTKRTERAMKQEKTNRNERATTVEKTIIGERAKKTKEVAMSNTIRLGDVIVDPTYQVRKSTSGHKVREYAEAMRHGDEFPAVTIEADTLKVVDGFTRIAAYQKVLTPDDKIPAIQKTFSKPGDRIAYAARRNMQNGYTLDQWERENVVAMLRSHGFTPDQIAPVVNWTVERVDNYVGVIVSMGKRKKTVKRDTPDEGNTNTVIFETPSGHHQAALKGGLNHLRGKTVPRSVAENIRDHYTGHSARFVARQLLYRINDDTVNVADRNEMDTLKELQKALGDFLNKHNTEAVA